MGGRPAGRKYYPESFSCLFKDIRSHKDRIRQFQVIRTDRNLAVNVVKGADFGEDVERTFNERVRREFGDFFNCTFTSMQHIPKENSGRFRQVKRVQLAERRAAAGGYSAPKRALQEGLMRA